MSQLPRAFAVPAREGLKIRNPETGRHLDPKGESVPRSSYWLRRQSDGDVVLMEAGPEAGEE